MRTLPPLQTLPFVMASASARPAVRPDSDPKLKAAAQEFESLLLSTILEKMNESFGSFGDREQDAASGTLRGVGMQALSGALSASGGIGIGKMLMPALAGQSLKASTDAPEISSAGPRPALDPKIKGF